MNTSHGWHIEKMMQGMFNRDYKQDAVYGLEQIRSDLNVHIKNLPSDAVQAYRDELTEVDYAIHDALALLNKREYSSGNTDQDRYAHYVTHFITSRIQELRLDAN